MSDWRPPSSYQPFSPPFLTSSFAPGAVTGLVRSTHRLGTAIIWLFATNVTMLLASIVNDFYARHVFEGSGDRVSDVSPGLAVGGWFIPFANCVVPFVEL